MNFPCYAVSAGIGLFITIYLTFRTRKSLADGTRPCFCLLLQKEERRGKSALTDGTALIRFGDSSFNGNHQYLFCFPTVWIIPVSKGQYHDPQPGFQHNSAKAVQLYPNQIRNWHVRNIFPDLSPVFKLSRRGSTFFKLGLLKCYPFVDFCWLCSFAFLFIRCLMFWKLLGTLIV